MAEYEADCGMATMTYEVHTLDKISLHENYLIC